MKKEHIYESLKEFREDRGMSQRELAEKLVYSPNYVGQVELGKLKVTKGFKKKFEEAYGHFGYKVKGINDKMEQKKPELPEASKVVIEKMKEEEKDSQGWRDKGRSRAVIEPKSITSMPSKLPEGVANLPHIVEKPIEEKVFDKVYLVLEGDFIKGFKEKEKAALYAWKLAMQEEDYRIDEVEVE